MVASCVKYKNMEKLYGFQFRYSRRSVIVVKKRIIVDLHWQESGVVAVSSCPDVLLPEKSLEITSLLYSWFCCNKKTQNIFPPDKRKKKYHSWDCYLACDIRGHGWWRLWMGVGVLGDKARVMGGDAAQPMGSWGGHLEETVDRKSHRCKIQHLVCILIRINIITFMVL